MTDTQPLTKKDFQSDQEPRWCPGCGDYAVLSVMQKYLAEAGADPAQTVFVSGIGCSSRFPYYMNTYGFHTIHGRAAAIATGIKTANPELKVWIATGDGDALSIGGNHAAHILRRNLDLNILMFNNQVYGLTKGQYSPTSPEGQRTKTSPMGAVDRPFNPISFALGCNATFVARTMDADPKHMAKVIAAADRHRGTSFIDILQNCVIFNRDCHAPIVDKKVRGERMIDLVPGEKMVFGANREKGIRFTGWDVEVVSAEEADVWDPTSRSSAPAFMMSHLDEVEGLPTPCGIFRQVAAPCYEDAVHAQLDQAVAERGAGQIEDLIWAGERWQV